MSKPKLNDITYLFDLVTQVSAIIKGPMEPIKLQNFLIDTGCNRTIVQKSAALTTEFFEKQKQSKET